MKKRILYSLVSLLLVVGLIVSLPSCKEDEPFVKPKLSFSQKTATFKESDSEVEIKVQIDKAYSKDIEIDYSIAGTAGEEVKVGTNVDPDYKITSDYLKVTIKAGETTGIITLEFYSDIEIEDDETIELQIEKVDSEEIEITRDDEINITLQQEDGLVVVLEWGVNANPKYTDVDMDLFLWVQDATSTLVNTGFGSFQESVASPEVFFLPSAQISDGTYGLSCNYYSGTKEPMDFQVRYLKWSNGAATLLTPAKTGTYTLANVNPWYTSKVDPLLVMTFKKSGTDYTDFSDITIPSSGSRGISIPLPPDLKRTTSKSIPQVLNSMLSK